MISLRSEDGRLIERWNLEQIKVDGVDSTYYIKDICGRFFEFQTTKPLVNYSATVFIGSIK